MYLSTMRKLHFSSSFHVQEASIVKFGLSLLTSLVDSNGGLCHHFVCGVLMFCSTFQVLTICLVGALVSWLLGTRMASVRHATHAPHTPSLQLQQKLEYLHPLFCLSYCTHVTLPYLFTVQVYIHTLNLKAVRYVWCALGCVNFSQSCTWV